MGCRPCADAVILACIASYCPGHGLDGEKPRRCTITNLQLSRLPRSGRGLASSRVRLRKRIQNATDTNPQLTNLMVDPWFAPQINSRLARLRQVVAAAALAGIPALPEQHLDYIDSFTAAAGLPQKPAAGDDVIASAPILSAGGPSRQLPHRVVVVSAHPPAFLPAGKQRPIGRSRACRRNDRGPSIDLALGGTGAGPDRPGRRQPHRSSLHLLAVQPPALAAGGCACSAMNAGCRRCTRPAICPDAAPFPAAEGPGAPGCSIRSPPLWRARTGAAAYARCWPSFASGQTADSSICSAGRWAMTATPLRSSGTAAHRRGRLQCHGQRGARGCPGSPYGAGC